MKAILYGSRALLTAAEPGGQLTASSSPNIPSLMGYLPEVVHLNQKIALGDKRLDLLSSCYVSNTGLNSACVTLFLKLNIHQQING